MENRADQYPTTIPKLGEIARRIEEHLRRMEYAQPDRGSRFSRYWKSSARAAGSRIGVSYISYQYRWHLTKDEAWRYLQWLDAGNEGRHQEALENAE